MSELSARIFLIGLKLDFYLAVNADDQFMRWQKDGVKAWKMN